MRLFAEKLLTPQGWRANQTIEMENGYIRKVTDGKAEEADLRAPVVTPGFVDLHHHGSHGYEWSDPSDEKLEQYLQLMASFGVTDLMLTGGSAPEDVLRGLVARVRRVMEKQKRGEAGGARLCGLHMEGPFLSRKRPGAMLVEGMLDTSVENFERIMGDCEGVLREMTVAPENEGALELGAYLMQKGVRVQAGHTDATFEQAEAAFACGYDSLCHTFNAARGIHHREPGVVTAALLNENVYCEAICDLVHVHPGALRLIYRMKGPQHMVAISDSTRASGLPDGEYVSSGHPVIIRNGVTRTPSGNLSGGGCQLDGSVRNLISIGIPDTDAFRMASRTPAERMGWQDLGRVVPGARADLAALDAGYHVLFALVGGKKEGGTTR